MGRSERPNLRFTFQGDQKWVLPLDSPSQTQWLGTVFGQTLSGGEVLALIGDLGVGKTTFVRGLAIGMGISPEVVSSPTYTIIQEYDAHPALIHVDMYRLENPSEIQEIGLSDYIDGNRVVIIEWADRLSPINLPQEHISIHMTYKNYNSRQALLQASGYKSLDSLNTVIRHLEL